VYVLIGQLSLKKNITLLVVKKPGCIKAKFLRDDFSHSLNILKYQADYLICELKGNCNGQF